MVSVPEAAKLLGVGKGSVDRARAVLAKAEPEVVEKMAKGEITVNAAWSRSSPSRSREPVPLR
jgi:hypothetical protein